MAPNETESVLVHGRRYRLGCLPRTLTKPGDGTFPIFGDRDTNTPKLVPRNKWRLYEARGLLRPHIPDALSIDQGPQNSCTASATVHIAMGTRHVYGQDSVLLSQAPIYALGNGGRDAGMAIDAGLRILCDAGTVPAGVIDPYDWKGYYRKTWPANWRTTGRRYRGLEAFDCPTFDHLVSANFTGFFTVFGVIWQGRGGHALVGYDFDNGTYKIKNTHGLDWGDHGFGGLPERQVTKGLEIFGGWALRLMTDPTDDGDVEPNEE